MELPVHVWIKYLRCALPDIYLCTASSSCQTRYSWPAAPAWSSPWRCTPLACQKVKIKISDWIKWPALSGSSSAEFLTKVTFPLHELSALTNLGLHMETREEKNLQDSARGLIFQNISRNFEINGWKATYCFSSTFCNWLWTFAIVSHFSFFISNRTHFIQQQTCLPKKKQNSKYLVYLWLIKQKPRLKILNKINYLPRKLEKTNNKQVKEPLIH